VATLFSVAFIVRHQLFCGFVLGDDLEDFIMLRDILSRGPDWSDQLHLRFVVWFPVVVSAKLLGISESSFFLPSWAISSALPVISYCFFITRGHGVLRAFLQAGLLAVAPFEVLIGTVHANDLFLSFCLALGLLAAFGLNARPTTQGTALAILFWLGFYVKLWVVYFFPPLVAFFVVQARRTHRWNGAIAFACASVILHGTTFLFWKLMLGSFLPFLTTHAATYPVMTGDLARTFLQYPAQMFQGSEFGTTLFGAIPYLFVGLLLLKLTARLRSTGSSADSSSFSNFNDLDRALLALSLSFFLLLNFFPNTFKFDRYYSAPRIFRYLAPLSLLMTIHVAAMLGDLLTDVKHRLPAALRRSSLAAVLIILFGLLNVAHAHRALSPALAYRRAFLSFLADLQALKPELLITDRALEFWLTEIYLTPEQRQRTSVISPQGRYRATAHEHWLRDQGARFPGQTVLLSGLGSYVFFGAHADGFRLSYFSSALPSTWVSLRDYGPLNYLPRAEHAILWQLKEPSPSIPVELDTPPDDALSEGMKHFESRDYFSARRYFRRSHQTSIRDADEARYFEAVTYFREHRWVEAASAFSTIITRTPKSQWVAAAHWHLGMCQVRLGDYPSARTNLEQVIRGYPGDKYLVNLATDSLQNLDSERGWLYAIVSRIRAKLTR